MNTTLGRTTHHEKRYFPIKAIVNYDVSLTIAYGD
jgi:hypothetical protein